jgi:hypothetical protein
MDNYDLVTQTKNISCIGAYCFVDKYIPPMTKVSIVLLLSLKSKTREKTTTAKVQCKGVVVRTEENPPKSYNIAIYFNEIGQREKNKIAKYVNQQIA